MKTLADFGLFNSIRGGINSARQTLAARAAASWQQGQQLQRQALQKTRNVSRAANPYLQEDLAQGITDVRRRNWATPNQPQFKPSQFRPTPQAPIADPFAPPVPQLPSGASSPQDVPLLPPARGKAQQRMSMIRRGGTFVNQPQKSSSVPRLPAPSTPPNRPVKRAYGVQTGQPIYRPTQYQGYQVYQ